MNPLRAKMIEQMQLHRKAPGTQDPVCQSHRLTWPSTNDSPDQLSPQEIRTLSPLFAYRQAALLEFVQCRGGRHPLFLCRHPGLDTDGTQSATKARPKVVAPRPQCRTTRILFTTTHNPKHRALLMTVYAAGLRVSEVVRLQLKDIESDPSRMLIRIHQGKGNKDRYTLLSERLLAELRAYWKIECPRPWLFPDAKGKRPMSSGTAQKIYNQASEGLASNKARVSILCDTALPPICSMLASIPTPFSSCWGIALSRPRSLPPCQSSTPDASQKSTGFTLFPDG